MYLLARYTAITGIVRANRGPPTNLKALELETKSSTFAGNGDVLVTKFQDKKVVYCLSTHYPASFKEKCKTNFSDRRVDLQKIPSTIDNYNKLMGSVDKADQLLEP